MSNYLQGKKIEPRAIDEKISVTDLVNLTFDFAGSEIIGRFTPNSGVELAKPHDVYFDLSQISIFDSETKLRL